MCSSPQTTDSYADRGYIPFANKAMLQSLRRCKRRALVPGVDAKVDKGENTWRFATIGYYAMGHLARSEYNHDFSGNSIRGLCYVTTPVPVLQAMFHQETHTNFCDLYWLLARAGRMVLNIPPLELIDSMRALNKDFIGGGKCARGCDAKRQAEWWWNSHVFQVQNANAPEMSQ